MIIVNKKHFSIPQICDSGQCFRLNPKDCEKKEYELIAGDNFLSIQIQDEKVIFECSEEEYTNIWESYFDLATDYTDYLSMIHEDEYLGNAADFGSGIRILRQDLWEMIVTFILSQQSNIPRIKKMIEAISEKYGTEKRTKEGNSYYAFPTAEQLSKATEEELRGLKLGYRSKYLCKTAKMVSEQIVNLEKIKKLPYDEARKEFLKLSGIGGKVADCICLFALHHLDAFPVDTHIQNVLETQYSGQFPFEKYRGCAGVMQQYIFYYDLKALKEEK